VIAAAFGGEVVVRADRGLFDVEVIEAQAHAGHRPYGIDAFVRIGGPFAADERWVLSGGLDTLSDRALRRTDAGATLATWLEERENLVVLSGWSPNLAILKSGGVEYDRLFVPFLLAPNAATPTTYVTGVLPGCGACGAHALCVGDGDATGVCACHAGFETLVPGPGCGDVDECAGDPCGPNALCDNFDGGFACDCVPTSHWDGAACTDPDQCATGAATCDPLATCIDTPEGYGCDCPDGYDGNGTTCTDIDECAENSDTCDPAATCTNTPGAFTCQCPDGWATAGDDCTPPEGVPECGDGVVEGTEACDDGDEDSGDGCSETCTLEDGWYCQGVDCFPDRDSDGVPDDDDVCPEAYDPDQADADGDGTGDACEGGDPGDTDDTADIDGSDDSGVNEPGTCGCHTGGPAGLTGLWLVALIAARSRRRWG